MFKNEEDKIKTHLLIALQSFYGIQCRYEESKDKDGLVDDLNVFIEFCDNHELFDTDSRLKIMLIMFVEKENLISWLKERLTKE